MRRVYGPRTPLYPCPTMTPDTVAALVAERATARPGDIALLAPGRQPLTYAGLADALATVATALNRSGIGRDDRVALVTANGPEAATAFLGIAGAAVCAPLNPAYKRDELEFYLTDLHATAVVVQAGLDSPVASVAAELGIAVLSMTAGADAPAGALELAVPGGGHGPTPAPGRAARADDVALVLHTSGTTARPKIVPLTHGRLVASARTIADGLALTPSDRCLNVMPLFHIHGLVGALLASLASGGSLIAAPGFVAPAFFGWIDDGAPTWYTAVPTIHQAVLARAERHRDVVARRPLRFIRSSSAALPVPTAEGLEAVFGAPVVEAYGMTEATHQMASNPLPPGVRKHGSVGRATGIEIATLDAAGAPVPPGMLGEVGIRGATVIDAYEANPEANARAFVDGWFLTGDQGVLDADGYLHLHGRLKELINRAGEKIAPVEVEDVLLSHAGVRQAVVFAIPDPRLGEDVAAAVVPAEGAAPSERELQAFLATHLADHKVPRVIRLVDEIPKGATGKVQRIGMAERLGLDMTATGPPDGAPTGAASPTGSAGPDAPPATPSVLPRTAREADVAAIWAEVLGLDAVGIHDDFFAMGGDSMLAAMIVTRIGERLGHRDLPLATFLWAPTVERYARGLETGSWDVPTSPLLPIQPEGDRPPFFFVHIDDTIIGPSALRRSLDPDQPLYGLRAMGIDGTNLPPSIDGLAAAFINEVRTIQPSGPYYLGGYCSGGRVALEMARRLQADGETIALLGLVDPRIDRRTGPRTLVRRSIRLAGRLPHHLRHRQLRKATAGLGRQIAIRLTPAPDDGPLDRDRYLDALARTRRAKALTRYPGALTVFHSRQYDVPRSFWDGLAESVDWESLPVDHETVFQGDQGALFATRLCAVLRSAERDAEKVPA